MISNLWWLWIVLAAIFIIGEIFTMGFFLLWFGIGAVVAGILSVLGLSADWQWIVFISISGGLFLISRRFAERFTKKQPPGIGADRFVGEKGIVVEEIDNIKHTGLVKVSNGVWMADSDTGEILAVGEKIEVVKVIGTHLIVRILKGGVEDGNSG
ncbi:MAG: NfeD family protein [Candidatus Loosdrechtia sp.]|uniref:NfeD family protein n=1 Tax=Candidatus Loosdrechtia sp. TaxID=3101272 RepID=UPI003A739F52|nr:MAG: NfeD family protein [Candidatus Jettenia sp. AMX2]